MKLFQLIPFKHTRKQHWERVYKKNRPDELGWYQDYPEMSLKLITATGVGLDGNIIDVGGGTSKLAGILLDQGYTRLTVLDISGSSIERALTSRESTTLLLVIQQQLKPGSPYN